jgi:hypothetical protein
MVSGTAAAGRMDCVMINHHFAHNLSTMVVIGTSEAGNLAPYTAQAWSSISNLRQQFVSLPLGITTRWYKLLDILF